MMHRSTLRQILLVCATALFPLAALAADADGCGPQTDVAAETRLSNQAKWSSKSEVMSKSFDVFRGDSEDGPFLRINPEPIPAAGWSAGTKVYEFEDTQIDPCRDYYYYVEALSEDGSRHKVTGVLRAKAKRGAASAE